MAPDHSLTRASDTLDAVGRQWRAVAAVLVGSGIAIAEGAHWARPLALAAAIMLLVLTALFAASRSTRRDRALDLIVDGRENVPLAIIQRERQRIAASRTRGTLAAALEAMVEETLDRRVGFARSARPPLDAKLIAALEPEIRETAALLRSDRVSVRAVARTERMLTRGASPLYGSDVAALRTELRRISELCA